MNLILTPGEKMNPLWLKLRDEFKVQLQSARERNDGKLNPEETAAVRARIGVLKELIALDRGE